MQKCNPISGTFQLNWYFTYQKYEFYAISQKRYFRNHKDEKLKKKKDFQVENQQKNRPSIGRHINVRNLNIFNMTV